jgi:hypothetical protein
MAWIFELAIECGHERKVATILKNHFDGFVFDLANGTVGTCLIPSQALKADEENNWWVSAVPVLPSGKVVQHSESSKVLQKVAGALYERLKSAHGYRFALVGTEASQFNTFSGLEALVNHPSLEGLVLREDIYASFGGPTGWKPFAPNYVWRPYVQQEV